MNIEDSIEILKNSKKLYLKEKIDSDILETEEYAMKKHFKY